MASILTRIRNLFGGGYTPTPTPVETPAQRAARLIEAARDAVDRSRARNRPSTDERVPQSFTGGIAGKVWFLPYRDSTTQDTPEIRAAMRLMRRDGYVKAAWEPQVLTVAAEDWQVQPSEEGNQSAEEQAKFVTTVIEDYLAGGMPALVRAVCAPLGSDGHSLAEKVWEYADKGRLQGKVVCAALKAKDADPQSPTGTARLEGDRFGTVTGVTALREPGQPVFPVTDFVFSRYLTVFDEPLGEAAFRPAYSPYWMRDTVRKLRAIHTEKKMAGMLVGEYEHDDDKAPLEAALAAAKASTWMSVPAGTRVQAVQLSTASEPDYKSFDESLRDEIVTSIYFATLQTLTSGGGADVRGNSQVQKATSDLGPWLLMSLVTQAVNTQLIPDLIDFNFAYPAAGGYPKLTFGAVSNAELLELVQIVEAAQRIGLTPSKKYYAKALSIQQADPNDPDDALTAGGSGGGLGGLFGGAAAAPAAGGEDPFGSPPPNAFAEPAAFASFWQGPFKGERGGTYWLPDGASDSPENRQYGADPGPAGGDEGDPELPDRNTATQVGIVAGAGLGAAGGPVGSVVGAAVGGLLGWLAGSRHKAAEADARGDAEHAAAGDPAARDRVKRTVSAGVEAGINAAPQVPAGDAAATRAAWTKASAGLDPEVAGPLGDHVEALATERDPATVRSVLGGIAKGIAALPLKAAKLVVGAIGRFAAEAKRQLGPYGWWAGSIIAATAVAAAPALAVSAGLLAPAYALASAPLAAAGFFGVKRLGSVMYTKSAKKNWGEPHSERPTADEIMDVMVHRFGWRPRYAGGS